MAQDRGKCPGCDASGPVGGACEEKACRKRGYRFIPPDFWEEAHDADGDLVDAAVGRMVGDFLLVGVLGSGGFGTVYLALQKPLFRLRGALKLIEPPEQDDEFAEVMLEKFQGEAEVLADLGHPNIVRLLKYGVHQRRPYLVMEYVEDGVTLREEIRRRAAADKPLSHAELRHIFDQMLNGLEAAHARGIIHRDVKPENVMLQPVVGDPAHVRILDFGLAKVVDDRSDTDWSLGSPTYMAPEQVNRENLGTWTDLYGLGVMFFELVTGRKPFPGDTDAEIVARKFDDGFDPFEQIRGLELDGRLVEFMEHALAPRPEDRFETVEEFREGLEPALKAMEESAGTVGPGSADLTMLVDSGDILEIVDPDDPDAEAPVPPPLDSGRSDGGGRAAGREGSRAETGGGVAGFVVGVGLLAAVGLGVYVGQDDLEVWWQRASSYVSMPGAQGEPGSARADATDVAAGGEMAGGEAPGADANGQDANGGAARVDAAGADVRGDVGEVGSGGGEAERVDADGGRDARSREFADRPPEAIVDVSAGKYHSCGLRADGAVHCWGGNFEGELGLGHTRSIGDDEPAGAAEPIAFDAPVDQLVAVGDRTASFSCVRMAGRIVCWGANADGQLGLGPGAADPVSEPGEAVDLGAEAVGIAAGASKFGSHVCARLEGGDVRCWGSGKFGKLGYGHTNVIGDDEAPSTTGEVVLGGQARAIAAGKYNTCAILRAGTLRCWGWNRHGQLGLGHTEDVGDDEVPTAVEPVEVGGEPAQVSVGRRHVCARTQNKKVRCWGWNEHGQLGLAHTDDVGDDEQPADVRAVELAGPAEQVSAGGIHTCARLEGGEVQCWGDNRFGQLGLGHKQTVGDDEVPADAGTVSLGTPVVDVAAGKFHTCVALADGKVRCWGLNKFGQLGYGHTNHIGNDEPPASVSTVPLP